MKRFLHLAGFNRKLLVCALSAVAITLPHSFAAHTEDSDDTSTRIDSLDGAAQIECITPDGRIERLAANETGPRSASVLRDETLSCPLQEGITTFVIKLANTSLLDRFTFVNENAAAAGQLKIAVSNYQLPATSSKWVDVDGNIVFSHKRLFNLSMLGVEARYVKLSFKVENAGQLKSLRLYGNNALAHPAFNKINEQFGLITKEKRAAKKNRERDFDFAALQAKGRVVYASSGQFPIAPRMIDNNEKTGYPFASNDQRPTAIVELANTEEIHRVRVLYKTHTPGRFDVYLPEDVDQHGKGATDFKYRKPIASAVDQDGDGTAAVDFDPQGARYVAVTFTASEATSADKPFEIIEINAYGDLPFALLDLTEAPDVYASQTDILFPGEQPPEISTGLGVLAIPPTLPPVSP